MKLAALSFVLGAWLVQQFSQLPSYSWLLFMLAVAVALALLQNLILLRPVLERYSVFRHGLLALIMVMLGIVWASSCALWRMSDALPHTWEQKTVAIEGVVASVPENTDSGVRFRFDVEKVLTNQAVIPHHISLSQYAETQFSHVKEPTDSDDAEVQTAQFHAGERWLLNVRLKRPHSTQNPHGFDFESWALSENIRATGNIKAKAGLKKLDDFVWQPSYIIERLREKTKQRIMRVLVGQPYLGVINALVIGDDSQITVKDWQVFLRTGTTHLMSISGLHITMLAGLAFGIVNFWWRRSPQLALRFASRKAATVASVLVALMYALIAGFSVPTQRTFYMLFVLAVALWTGRKIAITQVLAVALLVVVVIDPWAVNAPGFWLSFGAVTLLAYSLGARVGKTHWLKAAVQTQWAVTIGMLPLLLVMFNQTSIISPLANAVAIPLISFVVTPLALLGSFLPIDAPLRWAYGALEMGMWALNQLNALPLAIWQQHAPATWTLAPALFGVLWLLLPRGFPLRWLGLLGFAPMLFILPIRPAQGEMRVDVLDVGQGLSVVVQTATHTLLYDTGPKFSSQSDAGSRIVVPYLRGEGIAQLNGVMVSHNDIDHSGGLMSVLNLMPVEWLASSLPAEVALPPALEAMQCYTGQRWEWDGVSFEVLHPSLASYGDMTLKDNDRSCVLKVTSQVGSLLLTGDIEKNSEQQLLQEQLSQLKSDVLVVPHHGSKTSSTPSFIEAVAPSVSIFTPGYLNRYKHPKPELLARYQAAHSLQYRSDYQGEIRLDFLREIGIQVTPWRSVNHHYWYDDF